ncbi:MAG: NAD(P)-dependent oxidoreductase [Citrobacter sp.]|uniref:NAD(P)-dependent oxidoreductase n=1 Tax=Citrobacter tructae TaxID=2562449 RepID=A0ABX5T1M3_9ENTR|nr:NAD(P)-dependent oxidoreductase [Citrobacter tructae]QBX79397.1 NAD(P)-dependent oxidoreductase [Citrobacter tructae]
MKILLTGASGFIGSAFLRRFADCADLELCGVGRRPGQDFPPTLRYHALSLERLAQLNFIPDVVIHAAGRTSPWGTPQEYERDNVETTRQVIDFCNQHGFPRLILLSSAAVYYRFAHQFNLRESEVSGANFTSEYGRSKYQAEALVNAYRGEKTIFRSCAVFGAGDRLLFPPLLNAARKRQLVRLRSDITPAQAEIMPVGMLCDYLLRAARHPQLRRCYNISAGQPVETAAFLDDVLRQLGLPLPVKTVHPDTALHVAGALEWLWRWFPLAGEPPITRFGVAVFSYSATLNITAMCEDFGAPNEDLHHCVQDFLQHYRTVNGCC